MNSSYRPAYYKVDDTGHAWWVPTAMMRGRGFQKQDLGTHSIEAQKLAEIWNRRWRAMRHQEYLRGY